MGWKPFGPQRVSVGPGGRTMDNGGDYSVAFNHLVVVYNTQDHQSRSIYPERIMTVQTSNQVLQKWWMVAQFGEVKKPSKTIK